MLSKKESLALRKVALFHINEWNSYHNPEDSWANIKEKQIHYDALNVLKHYKLIEDFSFTKGVKLFNEEFVNE